MIRMPRAAVNLSQRVKGIPSVSRHAENTHRIAACGNGMMHPMIYFNILLRPLNHQLPAAGEPYNHDYQEY